MFQIGDMVTLHSSNGKIVGYVTTVEQRNKDSQFVWVSWFKNEDGKSVVYSNKSLQKVS